MQKRGDNDEFDKYAASLAEIIKISDLPIGLASDVAVYRLSKGVLLYIYYYYCCSTREG